MGWRGGGCGFGSARWRNGRTDGWMVCGRDGGTEGRFTLGHAGFASLRDIDRRFNISSASCPSSLLLLLLLLLLIWLFREIGVLAVILCLHRLPFCTTPQADSAPPDCAIQPSPVLDASA